MLFRLEFEVKYLNGQTITVISRPATDVAFEREFKITIASLFTSIPVDVVTDQAAAMRWFGEMKSEHTLFLAWHSARATVPFDDWLETVDEVNWKFANTVDPTQPVQPATSSALSLPSLVSPLGNSQSVTTPTL